MNAKELRIGNYVNYDFDNIVYSKGVIQVDCDTFTHIKKDGGMLAISPIKLTEEWLLKFGFTRQPWGLVIGELLFKDKNHECKELMLEVGNGFRTTINFVHQLQNLYFALTGEELKISE